MKIGNMTENTNDLTANKSDCTTEMNDCRTSTNDCSNDDVGDVVAAIASEISKSTTSKN